MNTKLLRQKVLDLAIHGKLVPQNPEHEPASKLLERIRGESDVLFSDISKSETKLVSEATLPLATAGKPSSAAPSPRGKAPKTPATPISEDEIPFEIPENWCWCRLSDIGTLKGGKRIPAGLSTTEEKTSHIYIRVTDMKNDSISTEDLRYISDSIYEQIKQYTIGKNDLYLTIAGTIGRVGEVPEVFDNMNLTENALKITNICILKKYLMYLIKSTYVQDYFDSTFHQVAMPKLSLTNAAKTLIALPPLEEQKLIVEEIERIFALIDTVEQNKTDLETVIKQTKSKILDLAIHGKLVPQDKADEPASKMLEKLRAEKEEKIANGQLKRDKNDSYIYKSTDGKWLERKADGSEEEIEVPFEIPESWSWCRLPEVCSMPIKDGTHQTPTYSNKENGIPFLSSKDVTSGKIDWNNIKYITKELHEELYKRIAPQINDILLAKNGTTGISALVEDDIIFDIYVTLAVLRPTQGLILPKYLLNIVNSPFCKNQFNSHLTGIGVPNLHLTDINKTIIPLPPLEEQIRVVLKIEEIFSLVNRLGEEK